MHYLHATQHPTHPIMLWGDCGNPLGHTLMTQTAPNHLSKICAMPFLGCLREEAEDVAVALGKADEALAQVTGHTSIEAELGDDLGQMAVRRKYMQVPFSAGPRGSGGIFWQCFKQVCKQ